MKSIHLDPLGGIAGDMFAAALLDLRPDLEPGLREALACCPLLDGVEVSVASYGDGVLTGRRFLVAGGHPSARRTETTGPHHHHTHDNHHHHEQPHDAHHAAHEHVEWREIRLMLESLPLAPGIIRHAIGIFSELAEAEAKIHGTTPEDVSFHEVGAWDSIADILAAAWLIEALGPASWSVGDIPVGAGRVRTAHGMLPIPAPATALLLEGFAMIDDGVAGERVTPTGAAILRHLCRDSVRPSNLGRLSGSGYGFGARKLPGLSNCLRALAFDADSSSEAEPEVVGVLECEIDDQSGEDMAIALQHIRGHAAVLDALQEPVYGKKGRIMTRLQVLTAPHAVEEVSRLIFDETTTLGIRQTLTRRVTLARQHREAQADGNLVPVKSAHRPSGETTKVEADWLASVRGQANRTRIRRQAEGDDV